MKLAILGILITGCCLGQPQQLIHQYSNQLSPSTTAYTFFLPTFPINSQHQDTDVQNSVMQEVNDIQNLLLSVNGVTEVIFDKATALFTVIGSANCNFQQVMNQINEN